MKDRVESSSCCFVLVKQSHRMHKSMCVFFSSLNTHWSLRIHVLFQALSLLMSALYCGQSAFPHCLHTHNQTQAQSPNHNTHTEIHPNPLQPNIQQHGLTLYTSCQSCKHLVRFVYKATGEKHTKKLSCQVKMLIMP